MSDIPAQMTAIGIKEAGGPETLEPQQRPVPKPGAGEILVKVRAAGVNRVELGGRESVALMRDAVFGVAAADHQRHDAVADLPARRTLA